MIRVGNLTKFRKLAAGEFAQFLDDSTRKVRVTFNAPFRTPVYVTPVHPDGSDAGQEPIFLAVVDGLQPVEFDAQGAFVIDAEADVWLESADGAIVHIEVPGAVSTIRPYERRAVDPVVQQMQEMLLRNQERRMAPLMQEIHDLRQTLAQRPNDAGTPPDRVARPEPEPSGGDASPPEPPATAPGEGGPAGDA